MLFRKSTTKSIILFIKSLLSINIHLPSNSYKIYLYSPITLVGLGQTVVKAGSFSTIRRSRASKSSYALSHTSRDSRIDRFPIEHIRNRMSRQLQRLINTPDTLRQFEVAPNRIWQDNPVQYVNSVINCMPRRVLAFVDAGG